MVHFDPPDLQEHLSKAIRDLTQITRHDISSFFDEIINPLEPDFSALDHGEDLVITPETKLEMYLPHCDCERSAVRNYREFIELVRELQTAELHENSACWTGKRFLVYVDFTSREAYELLQSAIPEPETAEEELLRREYIEWERKAEALRKELHSFTLNVDTSEIDEHTRNEFRQVSDQLREINARAATLSSRLQKPVERFFSVQARANGISLTCSLTRGATVFAFLLLAA